MYVSRVGSGGCGLRTLRCRDPGRDPMGGVGGNATGEVESGVRNRDASTELAWLSGLPCAVDSICTTLGISSGYCASVFSFDRNNVARAGVASVTLEPTVGIGGIGEVAAERILHNQERKTPFSSMQTVVLPLRIEDILRVGIGLKPWAGGAAGICFLSSQLSCTQGRVLVSGTHWRCSFARGFCGYGRRVAKRTCRGCRTRRATRRLGYLLRCFGCC